MEINLIYVFSAVIFLGLINIIIIYMLKNKVLLIEAKLYQQNESDTQKLASELNNVKSELNSSIEVNNLNIKQWLDSINKAQNDNVINLKSSLFTALEESSSTQLKTVNNIVTDIKVKFDEVRNAIEKSEMTLDVHINKLGEDQKVNAFTSKQQQLANVEQLSNLVQTLRIENIIDITNELSKHTELKVETTDFIKYLGDCKVLKIVDTHSGQITKVSYEDGIKKSTDTFADEKLKYQMFYDETGKAQRGIEFDKDGNATFEYVYDDAGEISKRIEFNYDEAGQEINQIEKSY